MMKSLSFLVLLLMAVAHGDLIQFTAAGAVECDGQKIDVGSYAAPLAVDWNSDGLKDLLSGQFDGGMIRYYPNVGTNSSPQFDSFFYLMDGASPISVPYG